jgi:predicted RNA-binding Zn-ribbon protein involved in translation (DUF1610 family)
MEEKNEEYIDFKCPHCGCKIRAKKKLAGAAGKCPECGKIVKIPKEHR